MTENTEAQAPQVNQEKLAELAEARQGTRRRPWQGHAVVGARG